MSSQARIIHCTFCLGEGHHINRCQDPSIGLLHEGIEEIAAIENKIDMNTGYLQHFLSVLTAAELKVLGYKHKIPSLGKMPQDNIITILSDKYLSNDTRHKYIIENMNLNELDYFADKIYQYTQLDDSTSITLDMIRCKLYDNHPANIDYNVLIQFDENEINEKIFEDKCPMCLENIDTKDLVRTNCNHYYCNTCMLKHIRNVQNNMLDDLLCPLCRTNINLLTTFSSDVRDQIVKKTMFNIKYDDDDDDDDENYSVYVHRLPINVDLNSMIYINNGLNTITSLIYIYIGINIILHIWNALEAEGILVL